MRCTDVYQIRYAMFSAQQRREDQRHPCPRGHATPVEAPQARAAEAGASSAVPAIIVTPVTTSGE